jgi:hypothetical protein
MIRSLRGSSPIIGCNISKINERCWYLGIWVFGYLGIWVFGYLGIWVFGYLGIWVRKFMPAAYQNIESKTLSTIRKN